MPLLCNIHNRYVLLSACHLPGQAAADVDTGMLAACRVKQKQAYAPTKAFVMFMIYNHVILCASASTCHAMTLCQCHVRLP